MGMINEIAKKWLAGGEVKVFVGYGEGTNGRVRPLFVCNGEDADKLIYDERCTQNLAVYTYKKESRSLGKPAIVANINTLRAIIRLAAEKQLKDDDLIVLAVNDRGEVTECRSFDEMEQYIARENPQIKEKDLEKIRQIEAMTLSERWNFWQKEMENCIRCYACRQACPMCYCTQCTVEVNKPQWISVPPSKLGNLEWHVMRAMHLAGRCISCGQCSDACPMDIPIHLLPVRLAQEIKETYGTTVGLSRQEGCALSTFQPDDKENFIG